MSVHFMAVGTTLRMPLPTSPQCSGYVWRVERAEPSGVVHVKLERCAVVVTATAGGDVVVDLAHVRPWDPPTRAHNRRLVITVD